MSLAQMNGITLALAKAGLAAGTTTTISTTATVPYAIKGKAYSKAVITNGATPTTDANTGAAFNALSANQGCAFVFGFDASGNVVVAQGGIQSLDAQGNFQTAPALPSVPDTACPFGYLIAKAGSTLSGTWLFGTNNLSGVTGMTYTFDDVIALPDRPQTA